MIANTAYRTHAGDAACVATLTDITLSTSDPGVVVRLWASPAGYVFGEHVFGGQPSGELRELGGWSAEEGAWEGVWPNQEPAGEAEAEAFRLAVEAAGRVLRGGAAMTTPRSPGGLSAQELTAPPEPR